MRILFAVMVGLCPFWAGVAQAQVATESGGVIVFEAENFTTNISPETPAGSVPHSWTLGTDTTGYSGSGYMEATPNSGPPGGNADGNSPQLQYTVTFNFSGPNSPTSNVPYYIWIRGYGATASDDSVFVGIDGGSAVPITLTTDGVWNWSNTLQTGGAAQIVVPTSGTHTINVWMREDGIKLDRILLTSDATFHSAVGNAWHIPNHAEPAGVTSMRSPFTVPIGNDVTIWTGNQYQGSGTAGNQLTTGSTVFYRKSTDSTWSSVAMTFNSAAGNNKYYTAEIPSGGWVAGDTIQYYVRLPYSDYLPTFLYGTDTTSNSTEIETAAQATAYTFVVQDFTYWQRQNIYQILSDRFFNGDPSNDNADGTYDPAGSTAVHGGDFKGIQQKLDYIQSLGATAIWISPVVKNTTGQYHGYSGWDFYSVDPHWGTLTDLQNLVNAAHARGIQVIDDIVLNHGGDLIYSTDAGYPNFVYPPNGYHMSFRGSQQYPAPWNLTATNPTIESLFHNNGYIQNFNDATQVVDGELRGLDDFKTETTYVQTNMAAIYKYWIDNAGFDAFRIDTTKHVDHGCWQYWCPQLHTEADTLGKPNFFMFGEVEDGDDPSCGAYTGIKDGGAYEQDSVVDYPLYFMINGVFAQANANSQQIENHYDAIAGAYDAPAQYRLVTFLDNHDHARFLSAENANNNVYRLNVALAFLYSSRGIPSLYYGTEQGFNGGDSPANREDMFAGGYESGPSVGDNFNETHPIFQLVAKLNNFRRLYPAMSLGTHVNQWNSPNGPGLFAYARRLGTQEVFVVFNTSGSSQTLPARSTIYPPGTVLTNLLYPSETITVGSGPQTPAISVPGTTAKIFIAQSQILPLDPVVTSITPAHDAANVNTSAPIVITFSKAMNTPSVQTAFSTIPATTGTFSWSAGNTVLTYTPNDPGWPGSTLMGVRIESSATDAVSGNNFYAAFEARFTTAASTFSDTTPPSTNILAPADMNTVSGAISISGSANDNIAVQQVQIQIDGSDWAPASGTTSWNFALNSMNFLNGSHVISARAIDTSGNISPLSTINLKFFNVPGDYLQRISAGNDSDATDCDGITIWQKDQEYSLGSFGFTSGIAAFYPNSISGVCASAQTIYQHERNSGSDSTVSYQFDCPPGVYNVTLLEAETTATGSDQRVFNVNIEDNTVLSNFDIYAAAGGANIAWSQTLTNLAVADAQLNIDFIPVTGSSRISGIAVQKVADVYSDTDGIPDWWRLAYFDHAVGEDSDMSHAGDDPDGDGLTNLQEYLAGTNPLDPTSTFRVLSIVTSGADIQIFWASVTSKTYQLQRSDSASATSMWQNVGSPVTAAAGTSMQTDPGAAADPSHFYRVIIP